MESDKMKLRRLRNRAVLLGACAALAHAANPVYVGASYGLYKSTDAGATWTMVNIPLNNPLLKGPVIVSSVSIDPHDPSKIYLLGTATARAFFATADAGRTWSAQPFVAMYGRDLAVDFAGQVVYVTATATNGSGDNLLYKTTNVGATWTRLTIPSTTTPPSQSGSAVRQLVADATASGTLYVQTTRSEFFKSTDFGQTWTQISKSGVTLTSGGVAPQTSILDIHQDPRNPQTWYYATDHSSFPETCPLKNGGLCGLFKSTNDGASFTGLSLPSGYVSSVSIGAPSGTVYATAEVGGLGGTVMKTTDGGDTWTPIKNGLFTSRSGRVWADPNDPSTLYVNDTFSRNDFYVSTDAGAHFTKSVIPPGPLGCVPGNCAQQDVHDVAFAASTQPAISSVVNGATLQPGFAANSWATIFGTNLATTTDNWNSSIVNGKLPTVVAGVSVTMGGKPAYVYFVSPGQINVLAPDVAPGPVTVTVTAPAGTSAAFPATASQYGPAFFLWPGSQPVATRQDFSFAAKAGTFAGATTTPARPGDVIILWTTGLGPTNPAAPAGVAVPGDQTYATATPSITINNTPATVFGAALAPGAVGLYQIAIQVPTMLADGDWPIQAGIGGIQSPTGTVLTVQRMLSK
jgi:uncharacterized protein (TIGR03437 family)